MKKILLISVLAIISIQAALAADKVEGLWKSIDEKTGETTAAWKIYQKDGVLFGEILVIKGKPDSTIASACQTTYKGFPRSGDVSKMTVINTPWLFGLTMKKEGEWDSGNVIDPKDGKIYKCKITFRPADGNKFKIDTLEMRAEIGLGLGRSQFWERTTEAEINSMRNK